MENLKTVLKKRRYKALSELEQSIIETLLKLDGLNFESNYSVKPYFIDIAFPKYRVGLEIDGHKFHSSQSQRAKDALREEYLREVKGWKIERIAGWFCHRYPEITAVKVLRHIPDMQNNPLYIHWCRLAQQWYAREVYNEGYEERAKNILENL